VISSFASSTIFKLVAVTSILVPGFILQPRLASYVAVWVEARQAPRNGS
jgi:hypothetical protein